MRLSLLMALCLSLTACSGLIIRDDDSRAQVAGKVVVRGVNCILTILVACASEWAVMKDVKQEEEFMARYEPIQGDPDLQAVPTQPRRADRERPETQEPQQSRELQESMDPPQAVQPSKAP